MGGKAGAECNVHQRNKRDFRTHTARGRAGIFLTQRFPAIFEMVIPYCICTGPAPSSKYNGVGPNQQCPYLNLPSSHDAGMFHAASANSDDQIIVGAD